MIIAVDFDGTLVKHRYPDIGEPIPLAFESLKKFKELGATLILWTMRDNGGKDGPMLDQAVEFCKKQGVEFDYVNENPAQTSWTSSPKVYANLYIDDAAVGCPLRSGDGERPWADWDRIIPRVLLAIDDEIIMRRIREEKNKKIAEQARQKESESERMETSGNGESKETRAP